jgi:ribosome biogenesis protein Nip4
MSLDWSIKNVKNYKSLYRKLKEGEFGYSETEVRKKMKQIPEAIIFYTMTIGMREITEKNWEQFYNRINFWEKINGTSLYIRKRKKMQPLFVTKEDVQRMIGLKTNASTKSLTQFKKDLFFNKNI